MVRFFVVVILLLNYFQAEAQRFMTFQPPGGPRKKVTYSLMDEITLKFKGEKGFYTGSITHITDTAFFVNNIAVKPSQVDALRVRTGKDRAIIPRLLGGGAHLYLAVRIINSLINNLNPIITPWELIICGAIIVPYYVYEFAVNTKIRTYRVTPYRPLRIVILDSKLY
jgi:hypothetical protein